VGASRLVTGSHSSLEFDLLEQADPGALVQAIGSLREPRTTTGGVNLVVGFRPSLWRRVTPQELPAGVSDLDNETSRHSGNASKLLGYAIQPDGSLNEITSVGIPYNSPQGLAGF